MSTASVLITGAGRGLGRGLVEHYLSLTGFTVIAAVRDTKHENCSTLKDIPRGPQSKLVIIKIDNTSPLDAKYSMEILQKEFGIFHIDILIANAGICEHLVPLKDVQMTQINQNLVVNTWSLLHLYQAALPMLMRSSQPKLVYISSVLGSISLAAKNTGWTGPYGLSKAAANFLIQKIGSENNGLIAMAIDPGLVQTDMGDRGAKFAGLTEAPVTVENSIKGIIAQIGTYQSDDKAGHAFLGYDGNEHQW